MTFLDLIFESDQFQYLYMVEPGYDNEWTLDFFTFPPENQRWINVSSSNYTCEEIYQHQVLTGNYMFLLLNTFSFGVDIFFKKKQLGSICISLNMIVYIDTEVLDEDAKKYPSDSAERWRQMDPLWGRMASLVANLPIKLLYLEVSWFTQMFLPLPESRK